VRDAVFIWGMMRPSQTDLGRGMKIVCHRRPPKNNVRFEEKMRQDSSSKVSCLFDDGLLEGVRRMVGLPSSQGMDGLNCTPGYGELVVTVGASDQLTA